VMAGPSALAMSDCLSDVRFWERTGSGFWKSARLTGPGCRPVRRPRIARGANTNSPPRHHGSSVFRQVHFRRVAVSRHLSTSRAKFPVSASRQDKEGSLRRPLTVRGVEPLMRAPRAQYRHSPRIHSAILRACSALCPYILTLASSVVLTRLLPAG